MPSISQANPESLKSKVDFAALDDLVLVEHCQGGSAEAFDQLVTRYRQKVYGTVFHMVRNPDDAWDITQEAFLKSWKSMKNFRGQSSFYTWLYRIVTNVAIDWMRRKKNQPSAEFDEAIQTPEHVEPAASTMARPDPGPLAATQSQETGSLINKAIATLSPEHQVVVTLNLIEGFQYNEIAEKLGISIGTVMSRLFYARKKLQVQLKDLYDNL